MSDIAQVYDMVSGEWGKLVNMPAPLVFHNVVKALNGSMYIIGGYTVKPQWPDPEDKTPRYTFEINKQLYRYNPLVDGWVQIGEMPTPRAEAAAVLGADGKIYVAGGIGESCAYLDSFEAYDPIDNSWEALPGMPTARGSLSAVADAGRIYAIGGIGSLDSLASVEIFDIESKQWSVGPKLPSSRMAHSSLITPSGMIFVIGGAQFDFSQGHRRIMASVLAYKVS